ncbi:uncharacterized protein [Gossypium hirsutum]|uniref:Uncharacterized protein isoform X1 n=1 Tax=Gossypium hirsutum TaxID=3635 RepID=A0ABM3A2S9_GOSHI|nr:uncharacterized protein LOC121216997 isoform X1 [Gossypium hirsutum]
MRGLGIRSKMLSGLYMLEIEQLNEFSCPVHTSRPLSWKPPEGEIIKFNFDASFQQQLRLSHSSIIARNKEGLVMVSCTYSWENVVDSTMAEARACLKAVSFAEELVFQDVCVEGDALTIIRKLQSGEEDRSSFSTIISAIKGRNTRFRTLEFRFVPREVNEATHVMAVEGRKHDQAMNWIEEVPREVERIVVVTPQTRPKSIYHTINQRGGENR